MSAGKIVLLVLGIVILLISLVPLLGGGALMWAEKALKDSEGFYTTPSIQLEKDSYAIVTEPANIDFGEDWEWLSWLGAREPGDFLSIRVKGSSNHPGKNIFIGVADTSEINTYLQNVEYDEITNFEIHDHHLVYTNHPGSSKPEPPTAHTFWTASAYGTGTQTLRWPIEEGTWSLVIMNEDGSRGLNLDASLGVKLPPVLSGIAFAIIIVGLVLLGVGTFMIYLGVRRPKASKE